MNFSRYIEISKALFVPNHGERCFHTTFVIRKGKIISIGINHPKSTPNTLKYNYSFEKQGTHSEFNALRKLKEPDITDCILVNVRLDKKQNVTYSFPCKGCQHVLEMRGGCKRLYYSDWDGNFKIL